MSLEIRRGVRRLFRLDLLRKADSDPDAAEELESMIEEEVQFLVGRGATAAEARQVALARLGPSPGQAVARVRSSSGRRDRRRRWREWVLDAVADVRVAQRALRKSRALSIAAILTLALAIGANTSIFSAVSGILLAPLPVAEEDRLMALWEENPDFGWYQQDAAPANVFDWKTETASFADVAAYPSFGDDVTLTGAGDPALLEARMVTGNFFGVLGVRPALGRVFRDDETWAPAGSRVAILSDRAWRNRFGANPAVIGQSFDLDGQAVEIVGVLPRDFSLPGVDPDLWRPTAFDPAARPTTSFRRAHFLRVIARLKPGVTPAEASAAFQVVVQRLQRDFPETNTRMGAGMTPLKEFMVGRTRLPLLLLLSGVAILLLIACANVANLLLIRAAGRERETAVRLALGAGRGRLLRQSLAESAMLAGLSGIIGIGLGWLGTMVLTALEPGFLPTTSFGISWTVLGYVSIATLGATVCFGVIPVAWVGRRTPGDVLRAEDRAASATGGSRRAGEVLLVAQVTLAVALTLSAGLLVRSYLLLLRVEPGFDPRNVLVVEVGLPGSRYDSADKLTRFFDQLRESAAGLPGVTAVAAVSKVPLGPPSWSSEFAIEGEPPTAAGREIVHREVSGDYLGVMRVPLLAGRMLGESDGGSGPFAIVVNQAFVRANFPNGNPLGRRLAFDRLPDSTSTWRTIVGVIGDERQGSLSSPAEPEVFAPLPQEPRRRMRLVIRAGADPLALADGVRTAVARLDPDLAITSVRTMTDVRSAALGRERFLSVLLGSLAAVGLILGLVGVYGVVAQVVRRRQREIGIRLALGADRGGVQWLVVRQGLWLTTLGVGIGGVAALIGTRLMRSLLYQVAPNDPITFVVVPMLILLTAVGASWLPAVRAGRTDPTEVLRSA